MDRARQLREAQGLAGGMEARLPLFVKNVRATLPGQYRARSYDGPLVANGGGAGDPVGSLVTAEVDEDGTLAEYDSELRTAVAHLRKAKALMERFAPLGEVGDGKAGADSGPGNLWCVSCYENAGYCKPAIHKGRRLCDFCLSFEDDNNRVGRGVPLSLLELHHQGKRITDRMIERALRPVVPPTRAAKRRGRKRGKK